MAYLNQIHIVLAADVDKRLKYMINLIQDSGLKEQLKEFLDTFNRSYIDHPEPAVYYTKKEVNWNLNDEKVYWLVNALEKINSEHILFVRLGEDWFDYELIGEYYNNPFDVKLKIIVE